MQINIRSVIMENIGQLSGIGMGAAVYVGIY